MVTRWPLAMCLSTPLIIIDNEIIHLVHVRHCLPSFPKRIGSRQKRSTRVHRLIKCLLICWNFSFFVFLIRHDCVSYNRWSFKAKVQSNAGLIWVTTILNWKSDCLNKESTTERAMSFGILIQNCNNIEISESRLWCWNSKITELEGVLLAKNFIQKFALPYKKRHTCWNPVRVWLHNT